MQVRLPQVVQWFGRVRAIGVDHELEVLDAVRTQVTNNIAITVLCLIPVYGTLFYSLGYGEITLSFIVLAGGAGITFFLNAKKLRVASRIWTIIVLNSALLIYSLWLGKETGVHYLSFVFLTFSFSLFDHKEPAKLLMGVLIPSSVFATVEWVGESHVGIVQAENAVIIRRAVIALVFIWLAVSFMHLNYLRQASENKLKQILSERDEEIRQRKSAQWELAKSHQTLQKKNSDLQTMTNRLAQFSYRLSHEIRRPLANVLGLTEVHENETPAIQKKVAHMIKKESAEMDKIVRRAAADLQTLKKEAPVKLSDGANRHPN